MKRWTDQDDSIEVAEELVYISTSGGEAIQISKHTTVTQSMTYSLTAGNLFGSQTKWFGTSDAALRYLGAALKRRSKREERISDE